VEEQIINKRGVVSQKTNIPEQRHENFRPQIGVDSSNLALKG